MKLRDVMNGIEDIRILGDSAVDVAALKYDSRRVSDGDMFAAIEGENFDGSEIYRRREKAWCTYVPGARGSGKRRSMVLMFFPPTSDETLALASRNFFGDPSSR